MDRFCLSILFSAEKPGPETSPFLHFQRLETLVPRIMNFPAKNTVRIGYVFVACSQGRKDQRPAASPCGLIEHQAGPGQCFLSFGCRVGHVFVIDLFGNAMIHTIQTAGVTHFIQPDHRLKLRGNHLTQG